MRILLIVLLSVTLAVGLELPYQAHSFNDLEIFVQLLKKGVRVFKMDAALLSRDSCTTKSTWKSTDNQCFYLPEFAQQLCCFGFRGDASDLPQVRFPFNTSAEFLAVLARPELQVILRQKIFLAINFQYTDGQNNLTKEFIYRTLKTIETRTLGITLATGSDNIILDYDYKCVIQGKCDQISRYISNSSIVLQSGDANPFHPHDAKKRYRNFNVPYNTVQKYCNEGFPAWVDKYDYPLIFWEPSNQRQIQHVLTTFLSPNCKRPPKHSTIKELAMASNLQPQMFQIYLKGTNKDLGMGKKLLLKEASNPFITSLTVGDVQHLLLGYQNTTTSVWTIELRNSSEVDQIVKSITLEAPILSLKGDNDTFFVSLQVTNPSQTNLLRLYNVSLQVSAQWSSSQLGFFNAATYYKGLVYSLKSIGQASDYYNLSVIDIPTRKYVVQKCNIAFDVTDLVFLDTLYVVGTRDGYTYMSTNCTKDYKLSFGTLAKVVAASNQLYIIQSSGMCQTAVLMNNNQANKCLFYKYKDFESLKNVPYLISYLAGTAKNIAEQATRPQFMPLGACSNSIYSSKLVSGGKVSPAAIGDKIFLAYEYVPISKQPVITSIFCGGSNFDNIMDTPSILVSFMDAPPLAVGTHSLESDHQV